MIMFLQVVPALIYLAAQVRAIKGTFNSIFNMDADTVWPVILIMAMIVIFGAYVTCIITITRPLFT